MEYLRNATSAEQRFQFYLIRKGENECWDWSGTKDSKGYSRFYFNRSFYVAHRYSYERFVRKIPDGLVIDHLCENTSCVNPKHLEPVSIYENISRALKKHPEKSTSVLARGRCRKGHEINSIDDVHQSKGGCRKCVYIRAKNPNPKRKEYILSYRASKTYKERNREYHQRWYEKRGRDYLKKK